MNGNDFDEEQKRAAWRNDILCARKRAAADIAPKILQEALQFAVDRAFEEGFKTALEVIVETESGSREVRALLQKRRSELLQLVQKSAPPGEQS
jgi:hypothetical protein